MSPTLEQSDLVEESTFCSPTLFAAAKTDQGRTRENNEDFFGADAQSGIFVVADGLGGHNAGERASRLAVEHILSGYAQDEPNSPERDRSILTHAHRQIKRESLEQAELNGMGTTVVMMRITGNRAWLYGVGDSSIFRLRHGNFQRIMPEEYSGLEALLQPFRPPSARHVVHCALGPSPVLDIDTDRHELEPGDLYLLCTDGLTNMIERNEIRRILIQAGHDLPACCRHLIDFANEAGGLDNVTAMLVRIAPAF